MRHDNWGACSASHGSTCDQISAAHTRWPGEPLQVVPIRDSQHTPKLTAGQFSMPAAHGEAMYAPEVNSRTSSARVQIAAGP
jgi:hypothetical protein